MILKYHMLIVLFVIFLGLALPKPALAVLPPDIIFSVGSSVVQFFSVIILIIGGLFSSLIYAGRRWFHWSVKNTWPVVVIFSIILIGVIIYAVNLKIQNNEYLNEIQLLELSNFNLQQKVGELLNGSKYLQNGQINPDWPIASSSSMTGQYFFSDNIILYGESETEPFLLEIDFNRIENSPSVFTHYTFISGNVGENSFNEYDSIYATTTELLPNRIVKSVTKQSASDLSPRDSYSVTILINNEPLSFTIRNLEGDFITRNRPSYTQFQSIGKAEVKFKGQTIEAQALVESVHSNDYKQYIFFPERESVDSTTHQFILWDEDNNFYLIDNSKVRSNHPQYQSHTWLLFKDSKGLGLKKSFVADIKTVTSEIGGVSWQITAPDLRNGNITLFPNIPFKQSDKDRTRTIVNGEINDENGIRKISGVLHLVE